MNLRPQAAPPSHFRRLPPAERRKLASDLLGAFHGFLQDLVRHRLAYLDLCGVVAYVKVKQDLERSIDLWRREMQRAAWDSKNKNCTTGAGRSPAIKAHGCAALALLAGSFFDALNRSGNARKVTA